MNFIELAETGKNFFKLAKTYQNIQCCMAKTWQEHLKVCGVNIPKLYLATMERKQVLQFLKP